MNPNFLYTADIAAARGVDRKTAYRWLVALEKKHGTRVVGRIGRKLYTTREALERIAPPWIRDDLPREQLRALEEEQRWMRKRMGALAAALRALRQAVEGMQRRNEVESTR